MTVEELEEFITEEITPVNPVEESVQENEEPVPVEEFIDDSDMESVYPATPLPAEAEETEDLLDLLIERADQTPVIPPNSKTLDLDETTSRFSGAIWYEAIKKKTIHLAGVGGIGSYVGFLLSRLKPLNVVLYDPDSVEIGNLSGQFYGKTDIGKYKVNALAQQMSNYSEYYSVITQPVAYEENFRTSDIMICGFDNMEARKVFFNNWYKHVEITDDSKKKECLFIDGRLAAEEFQVIAIKGDDTRAIEEYREKWLFSDEEAEETVCSYKQTSFMANMIASVMVNIFVNFVANECNPVVERDVPFITTYSADTMYFKVEM